VGISLGASTISSFQKESINDAPAKSGLELSSLCKLRRLREAVHRLGFLNHDSIAISSENYACVLRECARSGASAEGKQLHSYILQSGLNVVKFHQCNIFL
jgi:hypothetical protein